jgi:hypothetical protein
MGTQSASDPYTSKGLGPTVFTGPEAVAAVEDAAVGQDVAGDLDAARPHSRRPLQ